MHTSTETSVEISMANWILGSLSIAAKYVLCEIGIIQGKWGMSPTYQGKSTPLTPWPWVTWSVLTLTIALSFWCRWHRMMLISCSLKCVTHLKHITHTCHEIASHIFRNRLYNTTYSLWLGIWHQLYRILLLTLSVYHIFAYNFDNNIKYEVTFWNVTHIWNILVYIEHNNSNAKWHIYI